MYIGILYYNNPVNKLIYDRWQLLLILHDKLFDNYFQSIFKVFENNIYNKI